MKLVVYIKAEIKRAPRYKCGSLARAMSRVAELVKFVELRAKGKSPTTGGSKKSVITWV